MLAVLAVLGGLQVPAGAAEAPLRVRWLGVAGFSIEADGWVLLHDPYLSRPGLLRTLFRAYQPDTEVLEPLLSGSGPAPELARARLVLIGHSHFDHLGDAAWIASATGAGIAGTPTSANIARGYGAPEGGLRAVAPGERFDAGPFEVRVVESRHAPVILGRVPMPGEVLEPPDAPIHAFSFKMGGALAFLVTHRASGLRVFLLSSAAVHPPALEVLARESAPVDLLLVAPMGRQAGFAERLVSALRPRLVVPHHFDDFFEPLDDPEAGSPLDPDDLAAFEAELREAAGAAGLAVSLRRLALFEALELAPAP